MCVFRGRRGPRVTFVVVDFLYRPACSIAGSSVRAETFNEEHIIYASFATKCIFIIFSIFFFSSFSRWRVFTVLYWCLDWSRLHMDSQVGLTEFLKLLTIILNFEFTIILQSACLHIFFYMNIVRISMNKYRIALCKFILYIYWRCHSERWILLFITSRSCNLLIFGIHVCLYTSHRSSEITWCNAPCYSRWNMKIDANAKCNIFNSRN